MTTTRRERAPTSSKLAAARGKLLQMQAQVEAMEARETDAERKRDTRRKIVIGGTLMNLARTDSAAAAVLTCCVGLASTSARDRAIFESWPVPGSIPTNDDDAAATGDSSPNGPRMDDVAPRTGDLI